jgi:hypothetical protein
MAAADVLKDPTCSVSSAIAAARKVWGPTVATWEPDTFRISLRELLGNDDDSLMAKLLAGATVLTTNAWTHDHDVFFAFALACCGIPADGEAIHHPTVEQCCWAVDEIQFLTGTTITVDQGFDPQAVDPAIASLLHYDGHVVAHELLHFVQEELDAMNRSGSQKLGATVQKHWADLRELPDMELRRAVGASTPEELQVQLGHLAHCELYVRERRLKRAHHHVTIGLGKHSL